MAGRVLAALLTALLLAGCDGLTDQATRLDFALEEAASALGRTDGARAAYVYQGAAKDQTCTGGYRMQAFQDGPLVVWCLDANGKVVSSGLTTHHNNYLETARDFTVVKAAGEPLRFQFERRRGKPVIVAVY